MKVEMLKKSVCDNVPADSQILYFDGREQS